MGALASDRDDDWREYERTGKFLIFIWRKLMSNKRSDTALLITAILFFLVAFMISAFWE